MATIGKNILENLTTGMYTDSRVAYREYIQNACDQIDKAIKSGLISQEQADITIYIDTNKRYISIGDNATGVSADAFESELGDIANSNKKIGEDKGFRGIGRLCGLAYCKELVFTTSYKGENIKSIMRCNAEKMRKMLNDNKKYSVDEVLTKIITFTTEPEDLKQHYFTVELKEINQENTDLLDKDRVKEYLSFVAPVPYKNTFILHSEISDYAKKINYKIDEYTITINGEQIFKEYTTWLKEKNGKNLVNYDEISSLAFEQFLSPEGELLAWGWVGISRFEKQIPTTNVMRGIRLKQSNIQLGGADILKSFFKEPRGYLYFVGEIFSIHKDLIPNSQRDYFNETKARIDLEDALHRYCFDVLHNAYRNASTLKSSYKKQILYIEKSNEYKEKDLSGNFIDDIEKEKSVVKLETLKKENEDATKVIEKFKNIDENSFLGKVKKNIEAEFKNKKQVTKNSSSNKKEECMDEKKGKSGYAVDVLSKLDKKERKLVSKIWSIIQNNVPKELAEELIEKIKEEFK